MQHHCNHDVPQSCLYLFCDDQDFDFHWVQNCCHKQLTHLVVWSCHLWDVLINHYQIVWFRLQLPVWSDLPWECVGRLFLIQVIYSTLWNSSTKKNQCNGRHQSIDPILAVLLVHQKTKLDHKKWNKIIWWYQLCPQ